VLGVEVDADAVAVARAASKPWADLVEFRTGSVTSLRRRADTVVMNPPFGAQRRGADRPFWESAFRLARRRLYAFALADSRTFIVKRAVEAHAYVERTRPVPWELPRRFPHHRQDRVPLPVDLWVIRTEKAA
jgi:putative methylase